MQPLLSHEVAGTRVGHMPTHDLVDLWAAASSGIVKYGFAIEYRDLEPPRTGIFDGLRIVIDPDVGFEMQCFLLLHLFGHSVQWVAPSIEHKLDALQHTPDKPQFMKVLQAYEMEAARFALQLLHERGITDQDRWFSRLRAHRLAVRRALLRTGPPAAVGRMRRQRRTVDRRAADPAAEAPAGRSAIRVLMRRLGARFGGWLHQPIETNLQRPTSSPPHVTRRSVT